MDRPSKQETPAMVSTEIVNCSLLNLTGDVRLEFLQISWRRGWNAWAIEVRYNEINNIQYLNLILQYLPYVNG